VITPPTTPTLPPTEPDVDLPFPDIRGDVYATQIARAVEIGVVSGFQDGTFKPREQVTREQAVSMVVESLLQKQPDLIVPTETSCKPPSPMSLQTAGAPLRSPLRKAQHCQWRPVGTFRPSCLRDSGRADGDAATHRRV
jgi:N-acetylmuramoyl-L-alanine amidase